MIKVYALIMKNEEYGRRIVETICDKRFSNWIWGLYEFTEVPPITTLLNGDETRLRKYLPDINLECDLILSLGLPKELQALIPMIARKSRAKAVIIAVDNPNWIPPGQKKQISEELEEMDIAYAFPKPLCSLEKMGDKYIEEVAEHYEKQKLKIKTKGGIIKNVEVIRGSPCGSTWYIAEKIIGTPIEPREKLWEKIAKAHHTYPCLASMQIDPEIEDTILHKAQYIIREAIEKALKKARFKEQ